jgi:hypothetical protein
MSYVKRFGFVPDPVYTRAFIKGLSIPHVPERMIRQLKGIDIFLWKAKEVAEPNWKREAQGIGDCVSWGAALVCDCLLWNMHVKGQYTFEAETASESVYGGCRVEIHGGPQMGYTEDGASGSWAADWLKKWGVVLRKDYSQQTGNPDHDLRKYSSKRAQDWGYYGNGGKNDKEELDKIARLYPVQDVTSVRNADEVEAALAHGCPVTIASMVGFEGSRNQDGIINPRGQWPHQMCILGMKYLNNERLFRIFNSWNKSVEGPDPGIDDQAISDCSWWAKEQAINKITQEGDSYAFSNVKGFTQPAYDFDSNFFV